MSSSTVTNQELALFHSIDRTLFARLVFNMNRDAAESLRVMALFLWLEQAGRSRNLVHSLLRWPDTLLHSLAGEACKCLNCIVGTGEYMYSQYEDVPLLQSLTKPPVSLRFFHDNRTGIAVGLVRNANNVFGIAFEDLLQQAAERDGGCIGGVVLSPAMRPVLPGILYYENATVGVYDERMVHGFQPFDLGEGLSRVRVGEQEEDKKEVQPDERTIFLTFSKGYPISENDVREFFARKFGTVIEDIFMQEVGAEGQPLYARLVLRTVADMETVLVKKSKAKFSINGKHVWARKYVRKNPSSPPYPPTTT